MAKLPAFQFYVQDWLSDDKLRLCSLAARGMWIDMLCLMYNSEERGKLVTAGVPWSDEQIVYSVSCPDRIDGRYAALAELKQRLVARVDERGAVYSARMVRDEHLRQVRSEAGMQGGRGHKAKRKQTTKQNESKPQSKTKAKSKQTAEDEDEDIRGARAVEENKGGAGGNDDPVLLVGPDTSNLLHDWLGHARVSTHMLFCVGGLIRDYGQEAVDAGVRICIENNVKTFAYLRAVVANGSKTAAKPEAGPGGWEVPF